MIDEILRVSQFIFKRFYFIRKVSNHPSGSYKILSLTPYNLVGLAFLLAVVCLIDEIDKAPLEIITLFGCRNDRDAQMFR